MPKAKTVQATPDYFVVLTYSRFTHHEGAIYYDLQSKRDVLFASGHEAIDAKLSHAVWAAPTQELAEDIRAALEARFWGPAENHQLTWEDPGELHEALGVAGWWWAEFQVVASTEMTPGQASTARLAIRMLDEKPKDPLRPALDIARQLHTEILRRQVAQLPEYTLYCLDAALQLTHEESRLCHLALANRARVPKGRIAPHLKTLEELGWLVKLGERGGWKLTRWGDLAAGGDGTTENP